MCTHKGVYLSSNGLNAAFNAYIIDKCISKAPEIAVPYFSIEPDSLCDFCHVKQTRVCLNLWTNRNFSEELGLLVHERRGKGEKCQIWSEISFKYWFLKDHYVGDVY